MVTLNFSKSRVGCITDRWQNENAEPPNPISPSTIKQLPLTPAAPTPNRKHSVQEANKWWSTGSLNTVNLGSSMKIFEEKGRRVSRAASLKNGVKKEEEKQEKKQNFAVKLLKGFVNFFDLKLLCDPVFVNIMVGMSLAIFAELNFSILTPFILEDLGLSTGQSATFLSVLSIADLVFRFFAPFIGDYLKKPPRKMYMLTLGLLIISRFSKWLRSHRNNRTRRYLNSKRVRLDLNESKVATMAYKHG